MANPTRNFDVIQKHSQKQDTAWQTVPPPYIHEWLSLYPLHEQHFKNIRYCGGKVIAVVEPHEIEYSNITVDYYTASQIVLMASQMSYILAGSSMKNEHFNKLPSELYPAFIEKLLAAEIYYTNLHLRFKHKVDNFVPQKISIMIERVKCIGGLLYVSSTLDFANGSAKAQLSLVMPLI